ncbi:uncharacterized protein METZ01_LOCUS353006, partial [marine metagenome]
MEPSILPLQVARLSACEFTPATATTAAVKQHRN